MPQQIDIEEAFDSFVREMGGTVVKDTLGGDPKLENADYVIHAHRYVADLKCLQDNKLDDTSYMDKIERAWTSWRTSGLVKGDTPEVIVLQSLPRPCQRELISIAETPL